MKKFIEENINSEVRHILNLQSLLTEYDRENTYLNRQIVDLLKQNKSLKFDNIRSAIIDRSSSKILSREVQKLASNRSRISSKKFEDKSRHHTEAAVNERKHTKDEQVQVGEMFEIKVDHTTRDKKQDRANTLANSPFSQEQDIGSFSFGENTRKQMKEKKQILQVQQLDVQETVKKYQSKSIIHQPIRVIQIEKQPKQSPKKGVGNVFNKDPIKILSKEEEPPNPLIRQKRDKSLASHQRPRQSHHSIEPSRQITPCKSEKFLANAPAAVTKNRLESERSAQLGRRNQSSQKGKRFLSLISKKLSGFPLKTQSSMLHCC